MQLLKNTSEIFNKNLNDNENILKMLNIKPFMANYRRFYELENKNEINIIDHGYLIFFPGKKSFTGEGSD